MASVPPGQCPQGRVAFGDICSGMLSRGKVQEVLGAELGTGRDSLWGHLELQQEDAAPLVVPAHLHCLVLHGGRNPKPIRVLIKGLHWLPSVLFCACDPRSP